MVAIKTLVFGLAAGIAAAAPAAKSANTYSGWMTYYDTGLGACSVSSAPTEDVVALSHVIWDQNPSANPNNNVVCDRSIKVNYKDQSKVLKVVDRCVACGEGDIDLALSPFQALTGATTGKFDGITWDWA